MKINLNLTDANLLSEKSVLPTGVYNVRIIQSESVETKSGGGMLVLTAVVVGGEMAGRHYVERLNIVNSNDDAVRMAYSTLKTILTKAGHKNPNSFVDDQEAVGLSYRISVEEEATSFVNKTGDTINTTQNKLISIGEFDAEAANVAAPVAASPVAKTGSPFGNQEKTEAPVEAAPTTAPVEAAPAAQEFPWSK